MTKKLLCILLSCVLCLTVSACGGNSETGSDTGDDAPVYEEIPLTDDEQGILDAMGTDVNVVSDDTYIHTVAELMYHTSQYVGTVYQLEGVLSSDGEHTSVYRTLVNGEETQTLGLPLRYLEKEIPDGAWIRITGIVSADEETGETILDVAAIEALSEYGQAELPWDGSPVHQH